MYMPGYVTAVVGHGLAAPGYIAALVALLALVNVCALRPTAHAAGCGRADADAGGARADRCSGRWTKTTSW